MLFEELQECSYPNQFAPHDILSAMSFIRSVDEHVTGDIEAVTLRTIGVKHVDVSKALALRDLPLSLFTAEMRPAQVEELCKKHCPELGKLVVCIADRKIFRQAPQQMPFLL
ncbi:hypothetical protein EON64_03900 [archaeon]|nr:MAG: hypothetical protein EON64_03900 [archaeon]